MYLTSELELISSAKVLKIALLCDYSKSSTGTILDHINSIINYSFHNVQIINFRHNLPAGINLDDYDCLILHYTLVACNDYYISPDTRISIMNFTGAKLVFIQDEYRFIDATVAAFSAMKINGILTVVNKQIVPHIYPPQKLSGVRCETILTGYVPKNLHNLEVPAFADRSIDVGYRGRDLPYWLGYFAQEKRIIADKFAADAKQYNLKCNISCKETDRIYGRKWIDFISSCKAMLGVESGASVCDFTGEIQSNVEKYTSQYPDATFETSVKNFLNMKMGE